MSLKKKFKCEYIISDLLRDIREEKRSVTLSTEKKKEIINYSQNFKKKYTNINKKMYTVLCDI